jgi:hypothetical protein
MVKKPAAITINSVIATPDVDADEAIAAFSKGL